MTGRVPKTVHHAPVLARRARLTFGSVRWWIDVPFGASCWLRAERRVRDPVFRQRIISPLRVHGLRVLR